MSDSWWEAQWRWLEAEVLPPTTDAPALGVFPPPLLDMSLVLTDVPAGTTLMGDFSEIDRARREHRPVNPKSFVLVRNAHPKAGPTMADHPGWLLALVAAVERYEEEHSKIADGEECFAWPLKDVPADVRAMARGYAQARRDAAATP